MNRHCPLQVKCDNTPNHCAIDILAELNIFHKQEERFSHFKAGVGKFCEASYFSFYSKRSEMYSNKVQIFSYCK